MNSVINLFEEYGIIAVFLGVFAEQLGLPIPALPILLLSGAAGLDSVTFGINAFIAATIASMLADTIWFYAGKRFGKDVLSLLCKVSISPDSCVRQSEINFAKRGAFTLVIAKFVPGLSTLAPPLAGSLGMSSSLFIFFNLVGSAVWAGLGIAAGMFFNEQIESLLSLMTDLGGIALAIVGTIIATYIAFRAWRRWSVKTAFATLPRINPNDLAKMIEDGQAILIIDVRSPDMRLSHGKRIPGAHSIEISKLDSVKDREWPKDASVVTYCSCPNEVSSLKAAHHLAQNGWKAHALTGGIEGWIAGGYGLEVMS